MKKVLALLALLMLLCSSAFAYNYTVLTDLQVTNLLVDDTLTANIKSTTANISNLGSALNTQGYAITGGSAITAGAVTASGLVITGGTCTIPTATVTVLAPTRINFANAVEAYVTQNSTHSVSVNIGGTVYRILLHN